MPKDRVTGLGQVGHFLLPCDGGARLGGRVLSLVLGPGLCVQLVESGSQAAVPRHFRSPACSWGPPSAVVVKLRFLDISSFAADLFEDVQLPCFTHQPPGFLKDFSKNGTVFVLL